MQAPKPNSAWFMVMFCAAILLCHTDIIYTSVRIEDISNVFISSPFFPGSVWRERTPWQPWLGSMGVPRGMLC